jgi:hypothetical protein
MERERSVAVAGTLSFTIKMADQEDIVLRRWESDYYESQRGSSS